MRTSDESFVAFFSYARINDEHDRGKLTLLRKLLQTELWVQAGKQLPIFQDQENLEWGKPWMDRIKGVLSTCSVLIAVVSPSYLASQACRFELEYFLNQESQLKRKLILPILYIDTPALRNENDKIAVAISRRQWVDWQDLRFASLTSTRMNKKLVFLAKQILDLIDDKGPAVRLSATNSQDSSERTPEQSFDSEVNVSSVAQPDAKDGVVLPRTDSITVPMIDNFPDDWDNQWQPLFDKASIAKKPEPKIRKREDGLVHDAFITSNFAPMEDEIGAPPKQITVSIKSSGNADKDRRHIKTIFGTLISFHGRDRFSFQIIENGGKHLINFPNDTTRICPEMLDRLKKLIGEEAWRVEEITFQ